MADAVDRVREILNYTGFPFQHHCADRVSQLDEYQLSVEVPFTYPGTDGPMLGVHGTIDFLAARPDLQDKVLLCFVVECKKANEKTKNWVLLPNAQQTPRWSTFTFSQLDNDEREQFGVTRSVRFPSLGYRRGQDYTYCVNGVEANVAMTALNKDTSEKIYGSLKQAVHGARAFECSRPKIVEGIEYFRHNQHKRRLYIPVVITTANLYVVDFPRANVVNGEIPLGNLSLGEPRKWATYEFPLPDYLSYQVDRSSRGGSLYISKRTVFIVNDKSMSEFFASAANIDDFAGLPSEG